MRPLDVRDTAPPRPARSLSGPADAVPSAPASGGTAPPSRIHLSKADIGDLEETYVLDALRSGWVAPLGPHVDAFEREVAERVGVAAAVALSSGTAALHLGLIGVGVGAGSAVLCPTLTFAATANAIRYTGAEPVFVDAREADGNLDVELALETVDRLRAEGRAVSALVAVDLFGRCVDYSHLERGLADRGVPLVEDAAESLGARFEGRAAGSFGAVAALSFNGNKILTTSGGGMLLTDDPAMAGRARHLATQAREPVPWYEHREVGYNYRLSNLLAAVGRAQLVRLDAMIARRRWIRSCYVDAVGALPGVRFLGGPSAPGTVDNGWLTVLVLQPGLARCSAAHLVDRLAASNIEARPIWKPMHRQPVNAGAGAVVTGVAERLFATGLALPSGSSMSDDDLDRVITVLRTALGG